MNKMRKKSKNAPKRFAIYLRCSTDDQKQGDFTTIDTQREINREHVKSLGGTVVKEYADEGKTGTNINRPAFKELLADAAKGEFDTVCVTYMSRLGRGNAYVIAEYELSKLNVSVEMVKEKFTDDLAGYMGKTMTTMMDGVYPKMVSGWTKTKMERMVKEGYFCGGNIPFGYKTEIVTDAQGFHNADKEPPKRLILNPDLADCIRTAYDMASEGATSASIREYLNSVTLRKWTTQTVKNILSNETYTGVQTFGDWRNESAHPAIVNRQVWENVQSLLNAKSVRYVRRTTDDYLYYLAGLVVCPHCGCPCTQAAFNGGVKTHYYVCRNANKHGECPVGRINADKIHNAIIETVSHAASHWTVMRRLISESESWSAPSEQQTTIYGQLKKRKQYLEMHLGNLSRAIGEGRGLSTLLRAIEKAEGELEAVNQKLKQAQEEITASTFVRPSAKDVQQVWGRFAELWPECEPREQETLMQAIVHKVELTEKKRVTLELETLSLTSHAQLFELKSNLGAGSDAHPTNSRSSVSPPYYDAPIYVLRGGLLRRGKRKPKIVDVET
jgi:site-specific DNA recombinase